jgi:hypothetical protein
MGNMQSRHQRLARPFGALLALLLLSGTMTATAADDMSGRVPKPDLPKGIGYAKTDKCVRPTEDMRHNHMKYLLHHRKLTMHEGIRTKQFSLKNCVDCHASPKTNSVLGQDGFCANCHRYAAVSIDCFSCHSDKPEKAAGKEIAKQHLVNPHVSAALSRSKTLSDAEKSAVVESVTLNTADADKLAKASKVEELR